MASREHACRSHVITRVRTSALALVKVTELTDCGHENQTAIARRGAIQTSERFGSKSGRVELRASWKVHADAELQILFYWSCRSEFWGSDWAASSDDVTVMSSALLFVTEKFCYRPESLNDVCQRESKGGCSAVAWWEILGFKPTNCGRFLSSPRDAPWKPPDQESSAWSFLRLISVTSPSKRKPATRWEQQTCSTLNISGQREERRDESDTRRKHWRKKDSKVMFSLKNSRFHRTAELTAFHRDQKSFTQMKSENYKAQAAPRTDSVERSLTHFSDWTQTWRYNNFTFNSRGQLTLKRFGFHGKSTNRTRSVLLILPQAAFIWIFGHLGAAEPAVNATSGKLYLLAAFSSFLVSSLRTSAEPELWAERG